MAIFGKTDSAPEPPAGSERQAARGVAGDRHRRRGAFRGRDHRRRGHPHPRARSRATSGRPARYRRLLRRGQGRRPRPVGRRRRARAGADPGGRARGACSRRPPCRETSAPQGRHRRGGSAPGQRGDVGRAAPRPRALSRKKVEEQVMATEIAVETQHNFIGGKWVPSASGTTFEDRNPADNDDVVGLFPKSDHRDVDAAVAAAKKAFPGWRDTPAPRRAEVLYARRRDPEARQGEARPAHDPRDGQGPRRDARRRPGSDRHGVPRRGRGAAPVRVHDAVGAAEQVGDVRARSRSASARWSRRGTSRWRSRRGSPWPR